MLRIGIIGLGGIGMGTHVLGIQLCPDAEITAVCDIVPEVLSKRADEIGIDESHRFTDYRDLIDCPDVDAVTIATPNDCHVEIALYAWRRGKPFDCEKPLGLNAADTVRLADAIRERPVPHMLNFSYRFIPAARYARDLIREGKLGRIYHIYAQYFQSWGRSTGCPLIWRFSRAVSGTGTLADLGVHIIDLVRYLTGAEYESVCADNGTFIHERRSLEDPDVMKPVDVDDYTHFLTRMTGGIGAVFQSTRFACARDNYQRIEIYGEKGGLVYSLEGEHPLELCLDGEGAEFHELEIPGQYQVKQMDTFVDIVLGKDRRDSATVFDGHYAQMILDAVWESGERNGWVDCASWQSLTGAE